MSISSPVVDLNVFIEANEQIDQQDLDRFTRQLHDEIREIQVESVDLIGTDEIPGGVRSAEALTLGALAVVVLPTVLPKLVELLQAWLMRMKASIVKIKIQSGDRLVEVEYSPGATSPEELKRTVDMLTKTLMEKKQR